MPKWYFSQFNEQTVWTRLKCFLANTPCSTYVQQLSLLLWKHYFAFSPQRKKNSYIRWKYFLAIAVYRSRKPIYESSHLLLSFSHETHSFCQFVMEIESFPSFRVRHSLKLFSRLLKTKVFYKHPTEIWSTQFPFHLSTTSSSAFATSVTLYPACSSSFSSEQ